MSSICSDAYSLLIEKLKKRLQELREYRKVFVCQRLQLHQNSSPDFCKIKIYRLYFYSRLRILYKIALIPKLVLMNLNTMKFQ